MSVTKIIFLLVLGTALLSEVEGQGTCPIDSRRTPKYDSIYARKATCVLNPAPGQKVSGIITFTQASPQQPLVISGTVSGLVPNYAHGIHVHQFGDLTLGCDSTSMDYNPFGVTRHGDVSNPIRHAGDFGNIQSDAYGVGKLNVNNCLSTIYGEYSIIGRGLVVHANTDDLGTGSNTQSYRDGNVGNGIACCVIGRAN